MKFSLKSKVVEFFDITSRKRDDWVRSQISKFKKGSKVLDVGAGPCRYKKYMKGLNYTSQDYCQIDDAKIDRNSSDNKAESGFSKIDIVCSAEKIPIKNNSFDYVMCTEVLEHTYEPIKIIKEISRILKKGGILLLTAPLGSGLHQMPHHYYGGYTPAWYKSTFEKLGIEIISIKKNGGFNQFFYQEYIRYLKKNSILNAKIPFLFKIFTIPLTLVLLSGIPFVLLGYLILDKYDSDNNYTVGYHLLARKK